MAKPDLRQYVKTTVGQLGEINLTDIMYEFQQRNARKVVLVAERSPDSNGNYSATIYISKRDLERSEKERGQ